MSGAASNFDAVVFAGGGCRCFWQVGFWQIAAPALEIRPQNVVAVSAGAAMACMALADLVGEGIATFKARVGANPRNVYLRNVLNGDPVFPHARLYRAAMREHLTDAVLERLRNGPEIRVVISRHPSWLGPRSAVLAALAVYFAGQVRGDRLHCDLAQRAGFTAEAVSVRRCSTPDDLVDLILQSSCTPPFTPVYVRDGRTVLDGGLVDNVPVAFVPPAARSVLILLSRAVEDHDVPRVPGRTYVYPSQPIPIYKWDYTDPVKVQATYDLGRRDGERFARDWIGERRPAPAVFQDVTPNAART